MTRWATGATELERMLARRELDAVTGAGANGEQWLTRARRTVATAARTAEFDPDNAYSLAYDAARYACTGLLAQQGLRPTQAGGHLVVVQAMQAQFGDGFKILGTLRRRRNELEYPQIPGESSSVAEACREQILGRGGRGAQAPRGRETAADLR